MKQVRVRVDAAAGQPGRDRPTSASPTGRGPSSPAAQRLLAVPDNEGVLSVRSEDTVKLQIVQREVAQLAGTGTAIL